MRDRQTMRMKKKKQRELFVDKGFVERGMGREKQTDRESLQMAKTNMSKAYDAVWLGLPNCIMVAWLCWYS